MFFEQSTPFNLSLTLSLSLFLFSVSSPHLFVHFFYLFKAEIYGLYQAWKGKTNVTVDKNKKEKKSQAFILQQYICLF